MANPAFIDLSLYLPAGGVNGFEVNGHAVNGAGFVDSPFAGVAFELDPYRSILQGIGSLSVLQMEIPAVVPPERAGSYQRAEIREALLHANRNQAELPCERDTSILEAEMVSAQPEVCDISYVRAEYRISLVGADHPSLTESSRQESELDAMVVSQLPEPVQVSVVPPEYRSTTVPRGDTK
jgi:hypothetical protein